MELQRSHMESRCHASLIMWPGEPSLLTVIVDLEHPQEQTFA
jgi:hypothetical protein